MPKNKVYAVIIDDLQNILVGSGGKVHQAPREGYHLPGGTKEVVSEGYWDGLLKEFEEEFGTSRLGLLKKAQPFQRSFAFQDKKRTVKIFVLNISNDAMDVLVGNHNITDGKSGDIDSSFSQCEKMNIGTAIKKFEKQSKADWFVKACKQTDMVNLPTSTPIAQPTSMAEESSDSSSSGDEIDDDALAAFFQKNVGIKRK